MADSWELTLLKTIGMIASGGTPKTSVPEYYGSGIPWITPAEMGKKQKYMLLENPEREITPLGLQKSSAKLVPKDSIVYSKRAPIGHINIVPFECSTNQGCLSFTIFIGSNKFHYFQLKHLQEFIESRASGTTFKEVSATSFSDTMIAVPPLPEQKRIADKIIEVEKVINQLLLPF